MNKKEIILELCKNYVNDKIDHLPDDMQPDQKDAEVTQLLDYLTDNI